MKKRIVIAAVLSVVLAASANAQTTLSFLVASEGTPQEVQAAIDKHADVNAYVGDMTPLIIAATLNKDPEVITTMLKAGAKLEAKDLRHGIGGTALVWAAYDNSNSEVIATLLKAGADIKARTVDNRTALMWASLNNSNPEVIIALLKAGADAKAEDKLGKTALHYAQGNYKLKGTDALKKLEEASK